MTKFHVHGSACPGVQNESGSPQTQRGALKPCPAYPNSCPRILEWFTGLDLAFWSSWIGIFSLDQVVPSSAHFLNFWSRGSSLKARNQAKPTSKLKLICIKLPQVTSLCIPDRISTRNRAASAKSGQIPHGAKKLGTSSSNFMTRSKRGSAKKIGKKNWRRLLLENFCC